MVSETVNCEGFYGFFDTTDVSNPQADLYVIDVDFNRFTVDIATRKVICRCNAMHPMEYLR